MTKLLAVYPIDAIQNPFLGEDPASRRYRARLDPLDTGLTTFKAKKQHLNRTADWI
jgi:hypothetical protein